MLLSTLKIGQFEFTIYWPLLVLLTSSTSHGGVINKNVTVYERQTVTLSCYTPLNESVDWATINEKTGREYQRIHSTAGIIYQFKRTGRYSVRTGGGFYNLTIVNVTLAESGEYICNENEGFGPKSSLQLLVLDIDECSLTVNGSCSPFAVCENTIGSFACYCSDGYEGNGFHCVDIDECRRDKPVCAAHAHCNNTSGSYTCECPGGFSGIGNVICSDIDECSLKPNGGCNMLALCTNTAGSFACVCNYGLIEDGRECRAQFTINGTVGKDVNLVCGSYQGAPIVWSFISQDDSQVYVSDDSEHLIRKFRNRTVFHHDLTSNSSKLSVMNITIADRGLYVFSRRNDSRTVCSFKLDVGAYIAGIEIGEAGAESELRFMAVLSVLILVVVAILLYFICCRHQQQPCGNEEKENQLLKDGDETLFEVTHVVPAWMPSRVSCVCFHHNRLFVVRRPTLKQIEYYTFSPSGERQIESSKPDIIEVKKLKEKTWCGLAVNSRNNTLYVSDFKGKKIFAICLIYDKITSIWRLDYHPISLSSIVDGEIVVSDGKRNQLHVYKVASTGCALCELHQKTVHERQRNSISEYSVNDVSFNETVTIPLTTDEKHPEYAILMPNCSGESTQRFVVSYKVGRGNNKPSIYIVTVTTAEDGGITAVPVDLDNGGFPECARSLAYYSEDLIFAADMQSNAILEIDTKSRQVRCLTLGENLTWPGAIFYDRDNDRLIVVEETSADVLILNCNYIGLCDSNESMALRANPLTTLFTHVA